MSSLRPYSLHVTVEDDASTLELMRREAEEYRIADRWVNARDGSLMQLIPAGEFVLGSTGAEIDAACRISSDGDGTAAAFAHEMPQVRVLMPAFYAGVHTVTNAQFARFLAETRPEPALVKRWLPQTGAILPPAGAGETYRAAPGFERHPVAPVSWYGAEAYCCWAGLRLPKEAEWEKAARGGDGRLFPWGNEWNDACVQWNRGKSNGAPLTAPVDAFPDGRSPFGVFQMAGNVEEWCADAYQADAYQLYARGQTPGLENGGDHVMRGGSCLGRDPMDFRCAMRRRHPKSTAPKAPVGFRCASSELKWVLAVPGDPIPVAPGNAAASSARIGGAQ